MKKPLAEALQELQDIEEQVAKEYDESADEYWNGLTEEQRLQAFYSVVKRINQGELVEERSYRGVLYDVFGFGAESYLVGMNCGYMNIHNTLGEGIDAHKMKSVNRLEVIDDTGRAYVRYLKKQDDDVEGLRYSLQDDDKTLKFFVEKKRVIRYNNDVS